MPDEDDDRPRRARRRREEDDEDDDDRPQRTRRRRDEDDDDSVGGSIIPTKNGSALGAYYCGVFSFIPGLGCALGPIAIILGIMGVLHANKFPRAKGKGHAITGIVLGVIGPVTVPFLIGLFLSLTKK